MVYYPQSSGSDCLYRVLTAWQQNSAWHLDGIHHSMLPFNRAQQSVTVMTRGHGVSWKRFLNPYWFGCCCGSAKTSNEQDTITATIVCFLVRQRTLQWSFSKFIGPAQTSPPVFHMSPRPASALDCQLHIFGIIRRGARRVNMHHIRNKLIINRVGYNFETPYCFI